MLRSLALRPTGGPPATGVSGDPPWFPHWNAAGPGPWAVSYPPPTLPRVRKPGAPFPDSSCQARPWPGALGRAPCRVLRCELRGRGTVTPAPPAEHPESSGHTDSWLQGGGGVSRLPSQLCLRFISAEPAPPILPPKVRECRGDVAGPEVQSAGAAESTEEVLTRGPWPGPCFSLQARGNLLQTAVLIHNPLSYYRHPFIEANVKGQKVIKKETDITLVFPSFRDNLC